VSTPVESFREEHVLADGSRITLRCIRPEDAGELRRAFGKLSPRSRYQRFFALVPSLTDDMIRYLTQVDGDHHVAIVATCDSHDLKTEVGLGVARYVRLPDQPDVAEAAVTVVDDAQGRGIGRLLVRALARIARDHGVHSFRGTVLRENVRMRSILDEVGAKVHPEDGHTLVFDVPLEWPHESPDAHPLRRLLRAAAESLGLLPHGVPSPEPAPAEALPDPAAAGSDPEA
jgi:GNAT superfamily N-acetyltransferase